MLDITEPRLSKDKVSKLDIMEREFNKNPSPTPETYEQLANESWS
jgi:hypothetical protein